MNWDDSKIKHRPYRGILVIFQHTEIQMRWFLQIRKLTQRAKTFMFVQELIRLLSSRKVQLELVQKQSKVENWAESAKLSIKKIRQVNLWVCPRSSLADPWDKTTTWFCNLNSFHTAFWINFSDRIWLEPTKHKLKKWRTNIWPHYEHIFSSKNTYKYPLMKHLVESCSIL